MPPTLIASGIPELLPMVRTGAPGAHVSAIIRSICIRMKHFEDSEDGPSQTRLELGCAFEDAVVDGLKRRHVAHDPDRYCSPGQLELDGLFGTPDLLDVTDWAIVEIKLTWLSSRHDPESIKFWKYWVQIKAYCKMVHTLVGRLHVGHINGNYRGGDPEYNVWEWRFTQQELDENWAMLLTHAAVMKREVREAP